MLLWRKGGQEQTGEIDVKRPHVAAVVVAAGTSSRMQGLDKQLEEVGGVPVIVRTLSLFQTATGLTRSCLSLGAVQYRTCSL